MKLILKNYRCFTEDNPAVIEIKEGFTSFVGVNNSGKSSLLKFFYEFRNLFQVLGNAHEFVLMTRGPRQFAYPNTIYDVEELFSNLNNNNMEIILEEEITDKSVAEIPFMVKAKLIIPRASNNVTAYLEIAGSQISADDVVVNSPTSFRTIRPVAATVDFLSPMYSKLSNTLYIGPFRNVINVGTKEDYFDIKVGQSFITQWRSLKEGRSKRLKQETIRLEEEIRRIFGFDNLQINPSDDDQTLSVIVDKQSYMLPELGSGLSQFIMVLANASIKRPEYILIDEPELNLHPSLQLDFLTTLASYAHTGIMFATHSIGLAKVSSDSVYSVRKINAGESEVKVLTDRIQLPEFLGELSYSGYKELGLDTVLLVEGPKDVRVIQEFLKKLDKEHQIVIMPMGGGSLINATTEHELAEIKRITSKMHVVIDSEKTSEEEALSAERQGFVGNCKKLSIDCHVLTFRALENYLSDKAVKAVKGPNYRALNSYEKLSEVDPHWKKSENWKIAHEMEKREFETNDLGEFLKKL